jgi:hypothetical protein
MFILFFKKARNKLSGLEPYSSQGKYNDYYTFRGCYTAPTQRVNDDNNNNNN